jgi:hypothetical protein
MLHDDFLNRLRSTVRGRQPPGRPCLASHVDSHPRAICNSTYLLSVCEAFLFYSSYFNNLLKPCHPLSSIVWKVQHGSGCPALIACSGFALLACLPGFGSERHTLIPSYTAILVYSHTFPARRNLLPAVQLIFDLSSDPSLFHPRTL